MRTHSLVCLVSLLVVTGCKDHSTSETQTAKVQVNEATATTRIDMDGKEGKTTMVASETKVAIPDTFPKDVPILKDAVPKLVMNQGKSQMLHMIVPQGVEAVAKEYQEKLKAEGWSIQTTMNTGDGAMIQATKDDRHCSLIIGKNEDGGSGVQLTVAEK